jgi:signal transduction histidine kinase
VRYPRHLATRLTVSFVLLFLVIFVTIVAVTLYYARRTFQTTIDDNLDGLASTIDERLMSPTDSDPRRTVEDLSSAAQFIELMDAEGRVSARSSNLSRPLPVRTPTGDSASFHTVGFQNSQVRVIVYPLRRNESVTGYIVAGSPIPEVEDSIKSLVVIIAVTGLVGLLGAVTGTVWLAVRESRPLRQLTDLVAETAASDFQKDIPPSSEGSQEARELREAFAKLVRDQREALERERAFFADSSHVLRTPLAVLQGDVELLEQGVYGKERQEVVAQARASLSTMSRAVSGLLLLAREREQPGMSWEVVDLNELLERVVAEARTASPVLELGITTDSGLEVAGDRHQLVDLFTSLIENACHYTPAGGSVEVAGSRDDAGNAVIEVRDSGIGLSEAEAQHVTERFFRGATARRMFPGGSGLGLAIADRIARLHNGALAVLPRPEGGTVARVELPLLS